MISLSSRSPAIAVALALAAPAGSHAARPITGRVVAAADGDTITVQGRKRTVVSLRGVACPEIGQPFGAKAKAFVRKMTAGKQVRVVAVKTIGPGRAVGKVIVRGQFLEQKLLEAGLAWWDRARAPKARKLSALEAAARASRRGLWSGKPVPPWRWRRGARSFKLPRLLSPREPRSATLACRRDADCTFAFSACGCPACKPRWRPVSNVATYRRLQKSYSNRSIGCGCLRCKPRWVGTKAVCVRKQCRALHRSKP